MIPAYFRGYRRVFAWSRLCTVSLLFGCSSSPPASPAPPPAPVNVLQAWRQELDAWTDFPGTTQPLPNHVARVAAAVEGTVLSVLPEKANKSPASEGARVQAGQIIVQLDAHIAQDNLAKAEAAQKQAAAQRQQADNAVQAASNTLRRLEKLRNSTQNTGTPLISAPEVEKAQTTLRDAQAQEQAAIAKQSSTAADVQALQRQLSLYTLRAPISGWLGTIRVAPGQTIAIGTTVAEIVDLEEIDVVCLVPPSRIRRIALGQPAEIVHTDTQAAQPASPARGRVVYIAVQAATETGSFEVKVRFPNHDVRLRANMVVPIRIQTEPPRERLVIPMDALRINQEPPVVVIVDAIHIENDAKVGTARILQPVLGVQNPQMRLVEILGLVDVAHKAPVPSLTDAWFVVSGGHGLEDGDLVRMTEVPHSKG